MKRAALIILLLTGMLNISLGQTSKSPDLFPIAVDGKYGYINHKGDLIIEPKFKAALNFTEGLALVMV